MTITLQVTEKQAEAIQARFGLLDTSEASITECLDKWVTRVKRDWVAQQDIIVKQSIKEAVEGADAAQLTQIQTILGI